MSIMLTLFIEALSMISFRFYHIFAGKFSKEPQTVLPLTIQYEQPPSYRRRMYDTPLEEVVVTV